MGQLAGLLRRRLRWTQAQVAAKAGVGRWKVIQLEAGELSGLRFGDVESCLDTLGAWLVVSAAYHGAEADRLLDEVHARLVATIVGVLSKLGWQTRVEISFSEFGERGSIDVLAWYPAMRVLLVIEVKSELGSIEGTLRPLDVKVRLARKVARERFGWEARLVSRMTVLPEDSAARRAVGRNAPTLDAMLPGTFPSASSLAAPALRADCRNLVSVSCRTSRHYAEPVIDSAGPPATPTLR